MDYNNIISRIHKDWLPFFEDPANPGRGFIPSTATIQPRTTYTYKKS